MSFQLRPYQQKAVEDLRQAYGQGKQAPILNAPTGAGKTVMAAEIIRLATQKQTKSLFMVPRLELMTQALAKLADAGITDVRTIQASNGTGRTDAPVTVASIPTLTTERWLADLPDADLVIMDECHRAKAATYQDLLSRYPRAKRLGLTATVQRGDGKALDNFDAIVTVSSVRELTEIGALVPCRVYAPPRIMSSRELAQDPVDAYEQRTPGEKAIVFCSTVEHAKATAHAFSNRGHKAKWICGESRDRENVIAEYQANGFRVLVNVSILIEGFDDPPTSAAILAKRFTHVGSYLQALGRILRPSPGKTHATVIDLCGSALVHGTPDLEREYSLTGKGISAVRLPIRQCQECGGVFVARQSCPYCDFELPALTRKQAKALGLELHHVTAETERRPWFSKLTAKHGGMCKVCFRGIQKGDEIVWAKGKGAKHAQCSAVSKAKGAAA